MRTDRNIGLTYSQAALIALNIAVFIIAMTSPIFWLNNEIASHRFFWSMDGIDQFSLHTGIQKIDFLKIFAAKYVDGIFRTRQFSYLVEMVSFKFWQYLGIGFFRNYSLMAVHVLNTALLGRLIFLLTRHKGISWVGALLFLNSGVSIATLLYPFRNAKLLVAALFLICWICVAGTKRKFPDLGHLRIAGFLTCMLLAFFTDEMAFFIFPLLFIYMILKDGRQLLRSQKFWIILFLSGTIFAVLSCIFYTLSLRIEGQPEAIEHLKFIYGLRGYLTNPKTYLDVSKAFFLYFLRRNFGYWDFTVYGMLALAAFALLMWRAFLGKQDEFSKRVMLVTGAIIIIKALLLPHNMGVHRDFMPPNTVFPSLFFFSYHYTYVDNLLVVFIIALMLYRPHMALKQVNILLLLVLTMGASNAIHLRHGPKDALAFHGADKSSRQDKVKKIMSIKKILSLNQPPVYLSFPRGDNAMLKGRLGEGEWTVMESYIPGMYLQALEDGEAIVSLDNIHIKGRNGKGHELLEAKTFFDVQKDRVIDLEDIKRKNKVSDFLPIEINGMTQKTFSIPQREGGQNTLVFFIKGRADLLFLMDNKRLVSQQTYGQSYQMFLLRLDEENMDRVEEKALTVNVRGKKVHFIGPLIF